uniref:Small ribosomal subunit protein uS17 n=1 Tax=Salmo trutta TaxID=8032 RepID=A0A673XHS3_SALTR
MADAQTERAYQKQPTIFQNKKRVLVGEGGKEAKEKLPRYHKSVGLGFKTPREAIDGTYIDKKCPFTGNVSIRGRILSGVVTKMKMQRTIVIRRDYLHYIRKYNRFEKRHKNMSDLCRVFSTSSLHTSPSETLLPSESADPSARQ